MSKLELGRIIREHRVRQNITQKKLGEMLGKGESTVRMWELGKSTPPADIIKKISEKLEINYFQLMELAGYLKEEDSNALLNQSIEKRRKLERVSRSIKLYLNDIETTKEEVFELSKQISLEKNQSENKEILNRIKFKLNKMHKAEKIINQNKSRYEELITEIETINSTLDEVLNVEENEQMQKLLKNFLPIKNDTVELEYIFGDAMEVILDGRILTLQEKEKALRILKATFSNND